MLDDDPSGPQAPKTGDTMKVTPLAMIAAATVAATITLPATAHGDDNRQKFESPSGNIRCVLDVSSQTGAPVALCQLRDYTYVVPAGLPRDSSGGPCQRAQYGGDYGLDQGQPGYLGCSYAALDSGVGPWPTLDYGQSRSLGAITCDSEPTGVKCTDTSSGHFFRVSRDSYELS
jgi:hypothetical protein